MLAIFCSEFRQTRSPKCNLLTCDKVVTLTKKSYQFVLSLQGHREKSKSRSTGQKVVPPYYPPRKVCAPKAHTLFSQDTAVLRLSGLWYDFSTFLGWAPCRDSTNWYDFFVNGTTLARNSIISSKYDMIKKTVARRPGR